MIKDLPFFLIFLHTYSHLSDGQYMYYPQPDAGYYFEDFDYQENLQERDIDVTSRGPKAKASEIFSSDEYPFKGVPVQTQIPAPSVSNTPGRVEYDYIYDSKEYEPRGIYYSDQNYDIVCKTQKRQNSHLTTLNTMDLDAMDYKVIPRGDSFIVIDPNEYLLCFPTSTPDIVSTSSSYFGKPLVSPSYANIYPFQRLVTRSVRQTTKSSIQFKRFSSFEGSSERLINHSVRTVPPFFRMNDETLKERLVTQSILHPTRTHFDSFAGSPTLPTNTVRPFFSIGNPTPKRRAVTGVHPFKLSQESLGVTSSLIPFTVERRPESLLDIDQSMKDVTDNQEQIGNDSTNAFIDSSSKKALKFHKFQPISGIKSGKVTPIYKYVSLINRFSTVVINPSPKNAYKRSTLNPAMLIPHGKIIHPTTKLTGSSITKKNINEKDIPKTNMIMPKQETRDKVTKYLLQTSTVPHSFLKAPKDDLNDMSKPELQLATKIPFDSENSTSQRSDVSTVTKSIFLHDEQRTSKSMSEKRQNSSSSVETSSTVFAKKVKDAPFTPIRMTTIPTQRNSPKSENQTSGLSSTTFPFITKELKTILPSFLNTIDQNSSVLKFPSTKTLIASTRTQHSITSVAEKSDYDKIPSHSFTTPIPNLSSTNKPRTGDVTSFDNEMLQSKESPQPHVFLYSSSLTTNDNKEKRMTQTTTRTDNFETSSNTVKFKKDYPVTLSSEPHKKFSLRGIKFRRWDEEDWYPTTDPSSEPYDHKSYSLNGIQFTKRDEEDWYPTTDPSLHTDDYKSHTFGGIQFRRLNDDDEDDENSDPYIEKEENSIDLFHVKSINTTPANEENQTISISLHKPNSSTEHLISISKATQPNQLPSSLTTSDKFLHAKPIPSPPIDSNFKTSEREMGKNFPSRVSMSSSEHTGKTNLKTEGVNGTGDGVIVKPLPEPPTISLQRNFLDVTKQNGFLPIPEEAKPIPEPPLEHKTMTNTSWQVIKTENTSTVSPVTQKDQVYSNEFKVKIFKPSSFLELSKVQTNSSGYLKEPIQPIRQFDSLKILKPPILYRPHSRVNLGWRYKMGTSVPISKYFYRKVQTNSSGVLKPPIHYRPHNSRVHPISKYFNQVHIVRIKPNLPSSSNSPTIRPHKFFESFSKKKRSDWIFR